MRVVVIGGGQAGGWAARTVADLGDNHQVILLAEEPHPPYERPPLSKEVLLGSMPAIDCYMWKGDPGFEVRRQTRCTSIDRAGKRVSLSDGTSLDYDRLIIATGGRVRRLASRDAYHLRTIEDAQALGAAMVAGASMLVVGGGWIGLEVAAAGRNRDMTVTVVEAGNRLCGRAMPPFVSDYLQDLHVRHGVTFHYQATANDFAGDLIVAGIGIMPNVELAEGAGLIVDNGILVDDFGRTSDPEIFAAGDVANRNGSRIESWANAQNQAIAAARTAVGLSTPYRDVPWFWSTQYDVNLQFLGCFDPSDRLVVRHGLATDSFCAFSIDAGSTMRGAVVVNQPREVRPSRKLIEEGATLDLDRLSDSTTKLLDTARRPQPVLT